MQFDTPGNNTKKKHVRVEFDKSIVVPKTLYEQLLKQNKRKADWKKPDNNAKKKVRLLSKKDAPAKTLYDLLTGKRTENDGVGRTDRQRAALEKSRVKGKTERLKLANRSRRPSSRSLLSTQASWPASRGGR